MAASALNKRRKELRSDLSTIEKQIYDLETHYLEETRDIGNIFTGWDLFLSNDKVKIKKQIVRDERLVSLSSASSPAVKNEKIAMKSRDRREKEGGGSTAPTTTTSTTAAAANGDLASAGGESYDRKEMVVTKNSKRKAGDE